MANQHYNRKLEFNISLGFRVKLTEISDYNYLSEENLLEVEKDFKEEIYNFIRTQIRGEYNQVDVSKMVDFCKFSIE